MLIIITIHCHNYGEDSLGYYLPFINMLNFWIFLTYYQRNYSQIYGDPLSRL